MGWFWLHPLHFSNCGRMSENKESLVINVSVEDEVLQSEEKEEERKDVSRTKDLSACKKQEKDVSSLDRLRSSNLPILMNRQANLRVMTAS